MNLRTQHIDIYNFGLVDFKRFSSIFLLMLLSMSFIIENSTPCEGEVVELLESSEKEKEAKEKKILIADINIPSLNCEFVSEIDIRFNNLMAPNEINLEVQTPPPEHV